MFVPEQSQRRAVAKADATVAVRTQHGDANRCERDLRQFLFIAQLIVVTVPLAIVLHLRDEVLRRTERIARQRNIDLHWNQAAVRGDIAFMLACVTHRSAKQCLSRPFIAVTICLNGDRKSTRLNSSHSCASRMPSSA